MVAVLEDAIWILVDVCIGSNEPSAMVDFLISYSAMIDEKVFSFFDSVDWLNVFVSILQAFPFIAVQFVVIWYCFKKGMSLINS